MAYGERTVYITADIDAPLISEVMAAISKLSSSTKPISIVISSGGGNISHGIALYDYIQACPCRIDTYAVGAVESIALLILVAGDKRYAYANTRFMAHEGSGTGSEENEPMSHSMAHTKEALYVDALVNKLLADRTTLSLKKWAAMKAPRYFGAIEALAWGVVDTIIEV